LVNLGKAVGVVVLVVLIASGVLTFSAVLGGDFAWNAISNARSFVTADHEFGWNWKTLMRVLLILVVFVVFLGTIRKDLMALFKKAY
jgi:hypothetical protein